LPPQPRHRAIQLPRNPSTTPFILHTNQLPHQPLAAPSILHAIHGIAPCIHRAIQSKVPSMAPRHSCHGASRLQPFQ
jgi:hypothetical protein